MDKIFVRIKMAIKCLVLVVLLVLLQTSAAKRFVAPLSQPFKNFQNKLAWFCIDVTVTFHM
jgi:hypothetical protein